jgi:nitrile hydratase accessory protein
MRTNDLPLIPRDKEGPLFQEPWEAQAFALTVSLSESGKFTWAEWTTVLSQEIAAARERGEPDLGDNYYEYWLSALERICAEKNLVSPENANHYKELWRRAYLNTPHGMPVELDAAFMEEIVDRKQQEST